LGEAKNCLGMKLKRDWDNDTLLLHQEDYIKSILKRFRMENCYGSKTPMEGRPIFGKSNKTNKCRKAGVPELKLTTGSKRQRSQSNDWEASEPPSNIQKCELPYQELIGCLLYLSVNTRPDIAYAVSYLSQFNSCFTKEHYGLATRVLRYLRDTTKLGLKYERKINPSFSLTGYADADFAGGQPSYKSYSGYCFTLDGNLISWESRKQRLVAHATCEAEYISVTEVAKESLYLDQLIGKLFGCGEQTVTIYNDNQSAINLAFSHNFSARTKHMGVRKQFVRDCIESGDIELVYMPSKIMPADMLTKPLEKLLHEKCCRYLNMSSD